MSTATTAEAAEVVERNEREARPSLTSYVWRRFPKEVGLCTGLTLISVLLDASSVVILAPMADLVLAAAGAETGASSILGSRVLAILEGFGLPRSLWAVATVFLLLNVLRNLVQVGSWNLIYRTQLRVYEKILLHSFSGVMDASWAFFTSRKQGFFISTLTREVAQVANAVAAMAHIGAGIMQVVIFLALPLWISWQTTLACGAFVLIAAIPFFRFAKWNRIFGSRTTVAAGEFTGVIQESFSIAKVLHVFGAQKTARNELEAAFADYRDAGVLSQTVTRAVPLLYHPVGLIGLLVAYGVASRFAVPIGEFSVILYALWKTLPVLSQLTGHRSHLMNYLPSYDAVMDMLDDAKRNSPVAGEMPLANGVGPIAIHDVDFRYENEADPVLSNVTINIRPGELVALVGPSGAGKTTLADLILGLYRPSSGTISVSGMPLHAVNMAEFRRRVAYVPQESVLLNRSIRDNLLWANADATEEEIWESLSIANACGFVRELGEGLDTVVGDRGYRLSGGQMQRIALARAILKKPEVLVLDEATSALDTESERAIQQAFERLSGDVTIVMIAHRLSTIEAADQVVVLEKGRVVEQGSYSALSNKSGRFSAMLAEQGIRGELES